MAKQNLLERFSAELKHLDCGCLGANGWGVKAENTLRERVLTPFWVVVQE